MSSAKKPNFLYYCPIRGKLDSGRKEDEFVIECLKHLIEQKNIPKENIAIDKVLKNIGSKGKNFIKPDITVFDRPKQEAIQSNKVDTDSVLYVAEIKVDPKNKESAVHHQLLPAMDLCKNVEWGIYWDASTRLAITKDRKEFSIIHLPKFGENKAQITKENLSPLGRGVALWDMLEQTIRNNQGGKAKQYYKDILKLLISKYYDEVFSESSLKFCVRQGSDDNFLKRITSLCDEAKRHYRLHDEFKEVVSHEISLNERTLKECVSVLESYSLINTDRVVIQEFYMKFAPHFLKKDLDQYYTPKEIISFMTGSVKIEKRTTAIDPCSGSGDFMVGLLRRAKANNVEEVEKNLHCWDIDQNATTLAQINMILNGDGRSNVKVLDSLENFDKDNELYNFVITNPPFGKKTLYKGKNSYKYEIEDKKIGKLFIERGLNLLKKNGILISVIPTGYIDNTSDEPFRKKIMEKSRILGCVSLPSGAFKFSGSNPLSSILFLQKVVLREDLQKNYKIFVAVANVIGFESKNKKPSLTLKRREEDGAYFMHTDNKLVVINDLVIISKQLKTFAADENLHQFEKPDSLQERCDYCFTDVETISKYGYRINAKIYDSSTNYKDTVQKIKLRGSFCLSDDGIFIESQNNFNKEISKIYKYVATGDVYKDSLKNIQELRGWQLPDRAKQKVSTDDILVATMYTSLSNFLYIFEDYSDVIASNGFYKISINDKAKRLSFYHFLFSNDYLIQAKALTTGSVMANIAIDDLIDGLYISYLSKNELQKVEQFLEYKKKFIKFMKIGITNNTP